MIDKIGNTQNCSMLQYNQLLFLERPTRDTIIQIYGTSEYVFLWPDSFNDYFLIMPFLIITSFKYP